MASLNYNEYDFEWAEGFNEILKELGGTPPDDDEVFDFMCENKDSGWFDIPSNAYYEIVLNQIVNLAEDKYRYNDFSYYVNARDTNLYVNDEPVNDWEDFDGALIEEDMGKTGMINYELFADRLGDYSELDGKKVYNNYTERYGYINDEAIREGRKTNMGGMIWVSGSRDADTGSNWRSSDTYIVEEDDAYAKGGALKYLGTEKTRAFAELFEKANKKEIEQLLKKTKKGTIISVGTNDHQKLGNNKWSTPKTMEGSGYAEKYPLSLKRIATEEMLADMIYKEEEYVRGVPIQIQEVVVKVLITDDYDSRKENESTNPGYHNFDTNFYIREGFTKRYQDELAKYAKGGKTLSEDELWDIIESYNWDEYGSAQLAIDEVRKKVNKLPKDKYFQLRGFVQAKIDALDNKYKKDWLKDDFPYVGDDGWWDLRAEVVGRGKKFYNNIDVWKLKDMARDDDYKENFQYIFHDHKNWDTYLSTSDSLKYQEKWYKRGGKTKTTTVDDFFKWYFGAEGMWELNPELTEFLLIKPEKQKKYKHAQDGWKNGKEKWSKFLFKYKNEPIQVKTGSMPGPLSDAYENIFTIKGYTFAIDSIEEYPHAIKDSSVNKKYKLGGAIEDTNQWNTIAEIHGEVEEFVERQIDQAFDITMDNLENLEDDHSIQDYPNIETHFFNGKYKIELNTDGLWKDRKFQRLVEELAKQFANHIEIYKEDGNDN